MTADLYDLRLHDRSPSAPRARTTTRRAGNGSEQADVAATVAPPLELRAELFGQNAATLGAGALSGLRVGGDGLVDAGFNAGEEMRFAAGDIRPVAPALRQLAEILRTDGWLAKAAECAKRAADIDGTFDVIHSGFPSTNIDGDPPACSGRLSTIADNAWSTIAAMNNGTKLKALMRLNNLGYEATAARVRAAGAPKITRQYLEAIVSNPTRSPKHLPYITKAFGMTVEQWMGWNPDAGDEPPENSQSQTLVISDREIAPGYVRFYLHDYAVSAGPGAGEEDFPEVVQVLDLAEWWVRERGLPKPYDRIKVLTCRGDSMRGDIEDGDLMFVDSRRAYFDGPGIYVMNLAGRALVKRLTLQMDGRMAVMSTNPAYAPEYLTKDQADQLHIGGRVVTSMSARRW